MALSSKTLKSTLVFLSVLFLCLSLIVAHGGIDDEEDEETAPPATGTTVVNLRSKSLVLVKIYCIIILFFSTFLAGISPYFYRWNESFLLLGTQFSGGIFLATALIHFLSDANETFRGLKHKEYPYAFMLAAAGYCLTMLADVAVAFVAVGNNNNIHRVAGESRVDDDVSVKEESRREIGNGVDVSQAIVRTSGFGDTALLIFALCFHSIFEGIAIGLSDPPTKEIDAKRRDEEYRSQIEARKVQGDSGRRIRPRERASRAMPAPQANAENQSNIDKMRMITHANAKSKSEKFPPPHQDGSLGFPVGSSRRLDSSEIPFCSNSFTSSYSKEPLQTWSGPLVPIGTSDSTARRRNDINKERRVAAKVKDRRVVV